MAEITRWQYMRLSFVGDQGALAELNQLGNQGWEVVSVLTQSTFVPNPSVVVGQPTYNGGSSATSLLLKRPKT